MLTRKEFHDALQRMVIALRQSNSGDGAAALDLVLNQGDPEMKAQALFYQGLISAETGVFEEADRSWSNALQYAPGGSFLRFELELSLASASERQAKPEEAIDWIKKALETGCSGDEFAGVKALTVYLRLNDGKIKPEDQAVFACVCEKCWRVLELPGEPDSGDWVATSKRLADELENRARAIIDATDEVL